MRCFGLATPARYGNERIEAGLIFSLESGRWDKKASESES